MNRTMSNLATMALMFVSTSALAAIEGTMYKNPGCACCDKHAAYLRKNGFNIKIVEHKDLPSLRRAKGIPSLLDGCHTIIIGNYIVEGHVPAAPIKRMLAERPSIKGISVPGMPAGSPGMEHDGDHEHAEHGAAKPPTAKKLTANKPVVLQVYKIAPGEPKVYSTENYSG